MSASPQAGIFAEGSSAHYFLEYDLVDAAPDALRGALREALAEKESGIHTVLALGPRGATALGLESPAVPFHPLQGQAGKVAPATQRDLLFWVHGKEHDRIFDRVLRIQRVVSPLAELGLDLRGFQYLDSRDLTGFVDGSANPTGDDRLAAGVIPDGQPGAGGCIVLTQKWIHDLAAFEALEVSEQERIIGRTKLESIELEGDAMPLDSHVSRTDVKVDGTAIEIYRRSAPYGAAGEHGLYFIAFACEQRRFEILLGRMFGLWEDGVRDRLMDYTRPVTGSYWFAPSQLDLDSVVATRASPGGRR
ncbi:MAG: Dyp-type peroxidase [Deltaproteobacteria bacterium]|nr:Dyp-type peroxidase [Deltaproteobacteria bacterium]MBW2697082.1 Dyp-type peroxidase [Deltaproteobacteria bacterium]